ncbi:hypothetical protein [Thermococcus barophilus]|uniref:Uncharacterized protein n=1 Tax=Thermococcus barophilus (strain DSM 11836 / MP) TaxID=391623 RepID=F0LMP7_THEBM|nr:hypothetical protein [Thermococcus barophilus]ADT84026.1 hypothetical protein TERMP_01050 [Thermococcus barophilus MP]
MLLTNHAKQRIIKRLSKRRKLERVYSALLDFLKNAERIEVNEKIIIFTDKRKSLVCTKLDAEFLGFNEIMKKVGDINETYECVFWGEEKFAKVTIPKKFLEHIPEGKYYFYINKEKKALYIGDEPPLLAITLRPAKRKERIPESETNHQASTGTTYMSPNGSS